MSLHTDARVGVDGDVPVKESKLRRDDHNFVGGETERIASKLVILNYCLINWPIRLLTSLVREESIPKLLMSLRTCSLGSVGGSGISPGSRYSCLDCEGLGADAAAG